jgi:hypothetical protein
VCWPFWVSPLREQAYWGAARDLRRRRSRPFSKAYDKRNSIELSMENYASATVKNFVFPKKVEDSVKQFANF